MSEPEPPKGVKAMPNDTVGERGDPFSPGFRLSPRLQAILDLLIVGASLADVGTDHGLLAVEAIRCGRVQRVVAVDINEQPLQAARMLVERFALQDRIQLRLSDGLSDVEAAEMEQVVIAGMGGSLIRRILAEAWQRTPEKMTSVRRFVLQPMNHEADLRSWLAERGWPLLDERIVAEKERLYPIIVTQPGAVSYHLDPIELLLGPLNLERATEELGLLIDREIERRRIALREMEAAGAHLAERRRCLEAEIAGLGNARNR